MKKFTTYSGFIASIITISGMVFKIQHWPGATIQLVLGFGFLILFFLPSYGYNLLYNLTNRKSKNAGVCGSVLFILIAIGAISKINHWGFATATLALTFLVLCFLVLPLLMINKIKSSVSSTEKWLQFFWYFSLIAVSLGFDFKINHWPFAAMLLISGAFIVCFGYLPLAVKLYNNDTNRSKLYNQFVIIVSGLTYIFLVTTGINNTILLSFENINDGGEKTNKYLSENNSRLYKNFKEGNSESSKTIYAKVMRIKQLSDDVYYSIEKQKIEVMKLVGKSTNDSIKLSQVHGEDNFDVPTHYMLGNTPDSPGDDAHAKELKTKIILYKQDLLTMFDEKERSGMSKIIGLNFDDVYSENEERKVSWEYNNFYRAIVGAVIPILSKLQTDIRIAESTTVNKIYGDYINLSRLTTGDGKTVEEMPTTNIGK